MGIRNFLIEGVSGAGKTTVCHELQRRGHHTINGDVELAYQGDPATGEPLQTPAFENEAERIAWTHKRHIWNVAKVEGIVADHSHPASFFCGGSRNFERFIALFDRVFVLDVDVATLKRRLATRGDDEFGGRPAERDVVLRVHATREDLPGNGIVIDATAPIERVVDEILGKCG